jgi:hypothetical protein
LVDDAELGKGTPRWLGSGALYEASNTLSLPPFGTVEIGDGTREVTTDNMACTYSLDLLPIRWVLSDVVNFDQDFAFARLRDGNVLNRSNFIAFRD